MFNPLLFLYLGLVILCIIIVLMLFWIVKSVNKSYFLPVKLQDRIIDSIKYFLWDKCVFCGKDPFHVIKINVENLEKNIEIHLCRECQSYRN